MQELDVCDKEISEGSDVVVYKQVGPVLLKNDLDEAKETVDKRIEFISGEMWVEFYSMWESVQFSVAIAQTTSHQCLWYGFGFNSKKTESMITKKDERSQQLATQIQEMQSAMQKAAVEAAKAAAQQAA